MSAAGGIDIGGGDIAIVAVMAAVVVGLVAAAWRLLDAVEVEISTFFAFDDGGLGLHGAVDAADAARLKSGKAGNFAAPDGEAPHG